MENIKIDILLATYNGEKYIKQQIDSIISQTYSNWNIIFRDDGSKDATVKIIKEFIQMYPEKMRLIEDNDKGLGASGNFSRLLEASKAEYTMFCDQDDVWLPDKIKVTYEKMQETEKNSGNKPILIHTDLEIVDGNLNTIADSMFSYQNLHSAFDSINYMLVQNNITGCTMMINSQLREWSSPIPKKIIMHDWWLGLVASTFGEIGFVNQATIKYRQHGNNDTGAKGYSFKYFFERIKTIQKMYDVVYKNIIQANTFFQTYSSKLPEQKKETVHKYATILKNNAVKRIQIMKNEKYYKQGKFRNLGFILVLATLKNK